VLKIVEFVLRSAVTLFASQQWERLVLLALWTAESAGRFVATAFARPASRAFHARSTATKFAAMACADKARVVRLAVQIAVSAALFVGTACANQARTERRALQTVATIAAMAFANPRLERRMQLALQTVMATCAATWFARPARLALHAQKIAAFARRYAATAFAIMEKQY